MKINTLHTFFVAVISCLFFLSSAHAQTQESPSGFFIESGNGYMTCVAYKTFGEAAYFVVRTNRPDLFFDSLDAVKKCLLTVKQKVDNFKKYQTEAFPYSKGSFQNLPAYTGEFQQIMCREWRNKLGQSLVFEFTLPYIRAEEIGNFVHETPLRACLSTGVMNSVSWKENI